MTQLVTFKYTKGTGKTSNRKVLTLIPAGANMMGIDLSELVTEEVEGFIREYKELKIRQNEELQELMDCYDLKHSLKQFKPSGMHEVHNEKI